MPAVLLTGYATPEATDRAKELGIPVLFKPIDINELLETISALLREDYGATRSGRLSPSRLKDQGRKEENARSGSRIAVVPAPAVAAAEPKMATVNEFLRGPVPVPDVRQEGRYVYGIIQSRDPISFGRMGIGGSGEMVYVVTHGDIAAVVSRTPVFIFDPTRENALAHEHVIETVMKTHTIIPMSFGTVFRTDDDIREVLRSIYPSVKDVLKQMSGKVEFGLKVTWDRDHIVEELQREHEEIHRFHQEITRKHLQSTYFARMQLGRMIDKALEERSVEYVREIYEIAARHLRGLARQQADRRQDDHERRVSAGARARSGVRRSGESRGQEVRRSA